MKLHFAAELLRLAGVIMPVTSQWWPILKLARFCASATAN